MTSLRTYTLILMAAASLTACSSDGDESGIKAEAKYPTSNNRQFSDDIYKKPESIFGGEGLSLFGGKKKEDNEGTTGIGVNSFLWRATLDTVSFMPIASADPFGGTVITDWYTPSESQNERYKLNVFILGRQLRSDGVRVRVFQQVRKNGSWFDVQAPKDMSRKLEDTILTRARQMRVAQID